MTTKRALRKPLLLLLLITLIVAGATILWLRPPPKLARGFDWPAGTRYVYQLAWSSRDRVVLPVGQGESAPSELDLAGELTLRSYGRQGSGHLLGISIAPRTQHLTALGAELVAAGDATFRDREALLRVAPSGEITEVLLKPDDPAPWKSVVQALATELSMSLPAEPRHAWEATAADGIGEGTLAYTVRSAERLERRRAGYRSVRTILDPHALAQSRVAIDSLHRIALEGGHLRSLDESDQVTVTHDRQTLVDHAATLALSLTRVEHESAPRAPDVSSLESRTPGQPVAGPDAERQLLAQRVGDLTGDQLLNAIYSHPEGGLENDHAWLWRATGLLLQHPELCAELERAFEDAELNGGSRRLILDLLTGAGHAEAQAAMRSALASPTARGDAQLPLWLQRFSLVGQPQPETMTFLAEARSRALAANQGDLARASTFALGAATGQLAAHDPEAAAPYNRALAAALKDAGTSIDREAALRALGNAGLAENVPLVLATAHDGDIGVRAAAASALRKTVTPETTQALFELAADPAVAVGAEALASLRGRDLDEARVESLLTDGKLSPLNHPLLATLLAEHLDSSDAALRLLQELLARTPDVQLQARLRTLLGAQSSGG